MAKLFQYRPHIILLRSLFLGKQNCTFLVDPPIHHPELLDGGKTNHNTAHNAKKNSRKKTQLAPKRITHHNLRSPPNALCNTTLLREHNWYTFFRVPSPSPTPCFSTCHHQPASFATFFAKPGENSVPAKETKVEQRENLNPSPLAYVVKANIFTLSADLLLTTCFPELPPAAKENRDTHFSTWTARSPSLRAQISHPNKQFSLASARKIAAVTHTTENSLSHTLSVGERERGVDVYVWQLSWVVKADGVEQVGWLGRGSHKRCRTDVGCHLSVVTVLDRGAAEVDVTVCVWEKESWQI